MIFEIFQYMFKNYRNLKMRHVFSKIGRQSVCDVTIWSIYMILASDCSITSIIIIVDYSMIQQNIINNIHICQLIVYIKQIMDSDFAIGIYRKLNKNYIIKILTNRY